MKQSIEPRNTIPQAQNVTLHSTTYMSKEVKFSALPHVLHTKNEDSGGIYLSDIVCKHSESVCIIHSHICVIATAQ